MVSMRPRIQETAMIFAPVPPESVCRRIREPGSSPLQLFPHEGRGKVVSRPRPRGRQVSAAIYLALLSACFPSFFTVFSLVVLGAGIYFGHRKYKEAKEQEEAKLYELIERITELIRESSIDGDPYVSQPHVRDVLFPPAKRRSAELARWEQAVKFIDTNESRVATDVLVLPSGNECAVWKWIGNQSQKRW
nr:hypothetical protein Y39G8C.a - Caenorhabditis elegans [Caenorhabditis elegans]